jgi:hypothetical protein
MRSALDAAWARRRVGDGVAAPDGPARTAVNRMHAVLASALERTGFAYMCGTALRPAMFGVSKKLAPILSNAFADAFGARESDFQQLRFCPCSCFVVRRGMVEAAYAREPLTFERLVKTLAKGNAPNEIYMLERAWQRLILGPEVPTAGVATTP